MKKIIYSKGLRVDSKNAILSLYNSLYEIKRDLILFDQVVFPDLDAVCKRISQSFSKKNPIDTRIIIKELEILQKRELIRDYNFDHKDMSKIDIDKIINSEISKHIFGGSAIFLAELEKRLHFNLSNREEIIQHVGIEDYEETNWQIISSIQELKSVLITKLIDQEENCEIIDSKPPIIKTLNSNSAEPPIDIHNAFCFILKDLPLPSAQITWEEILDFKQNEDNRMRLTNLRMWVKESLKENITENDLVDKYDQLMMKFKDSMKLHKIKTQDGNLNIIVKIAQAYFDLRKGNFEKLAELLGDEKVGMNRKYVELREAENQSDGKEIAYTFFANEKFKVI